MQVCTTLIHNRLSVTCILEEVLHGLLMQSEHRSDEEKTIGQKK